MEIDKSIFKAYDIRGIYPSQLNEAGAYAIGRAFASLMKQKNPGKDLLVAVGMDMRLSSPALKAKAVEGILDTGVNVDDIGLVSTPTFYFAVGFFGYDGGLQVSASHNPKEYNGMKMVGAGAFPIGKNSGIQEMADMAASDNFAPLAETKGVLTHRENILTKEVEEQSKVIDARSIKAMKIVVDASNAMGSLDIDALSEKLPQIQFVKINFELDGTFPAHEADPMKPENTEELRRKVVEEEADLGIAIDGDADRYFFIDEKGQSLPQAILRGLMAQIELIEHPGTTVAYDIRPGRITKDMIDEMGGKSLVTPVGHSLIKEAMISAGATFGGESSGHYFYKQSYGTFEMPFLLVLKLLKYISEQNKPFSQVVAPFKRYVHSGEINMKVSDQSKVAELIEKVKAEFDSGKQIFIDGLTVEYPDVWFNLRGSNTEPLIRLAVEGKNAEIVEKTKEDILKILKA